MEAIDSLEEGGSVVDESRLSGWAHALIASTVVAAVLVVWRLTQWRRDHDLGPAPLRALPKVWHADPEEPGV